MYELDEGLVTLLLLLSLLPTRLLLGFWLVGVETLLLLVERPNARSSALSFLTCKRYFFSVALEFSISLCAFFKDTCAFEGSSVQFNQWRVRNHHSDIS